MISQCRLCGQNASLQDSHITPAFVYKWLKVTSATGHMRRADEPNQRVQDGPTRPWLCVDCEGRLGKSETAFATDFFHPLMLKPNGRFPYGPWLLRFCVSVSWRNLLLQSEKFDPNKVPPEFLSVVQAALQTWANVLLGKEKHPGQFEQHLFPLFRLEVPEEIELPTNFARYCLRAVSMNVVDAGDDIVSICKLGPVVVIGIVKMAGRKEWRRTKVHVESGDVRLARYELPKRLLWFMMEGAHKYAEAGLRMSEKQAAKIREAVESDPDRAANSESFKAMLHDIELFGDKAFGGSG